MPTENFTGTPAQRGIPAKTIQASRAARETTTHFPRWSIAVRESDGERHQNFDRAHDIQDHPIEEAISYLKTGMACPCVECEKAIIGRQKADLVLYQWGHLIRRNLPPFVQ